CASLGMLYTELLQLWNESVHAMDKKDWQGALQKLEQITEPTSRTLFNAASAHLCLGQLESALEALDLTIVKDQRLAVAFFQRAAVMMQLDRLNEALSDCVWAQKHLRGNMVIDYRQLGLRYKLYSWQFSKSTSQCMLILNVLNLYSIRKDERMFIFLTQRKEILAPLMVPEDVVFRPRKKDVEQEIEFTTQKEQKVLYLMPFLVLPTLPFKYFGTFLVSCSLFAADLKHLGLTSKHEFENSQNKVARKKKLISQPWSENKCPCFFILCMGLKCGKKQKTKNPHSVMPSKCVEIRWSLSKLSKKQTTDNKLNGESMNLNGICTPLIQTEDSLNNHTILYQMVALYDYSAQGPEDLEFSEGDTIDILGEVNEEWLEGHCAGSIGIFPSSFAMRENENLMPLSEF
uniref:Neutrophil cytosol factor 2-like n=1 Tax=Hippocampus comes TaxID=109280 RepID=A0A3Q2XM49_HIPCM